MSTTEESTRRSMSIESILDSHGDTERSASSSPKRIWPAYDDRLHKHRRYGSNRRMTLTCYHASVAQKSYGSEKRFLCPPPMITLRQPEEQQPLAMNMSVLADGNEQGVEQSIILNESNQGSFKALHVTASSKTKQFCLRVNISQPTYQPFATCFSSPISIISKPSKKTAKTRQDLNGIFTTSQISLYSRINSQTVRTKYLTSTTDSQSLCAKHTCWSAFDIVLIHQQETVQSSMAYYNHQQYHHNHQLSLSTAGVPLTYGSEILLKDSETGVCSPRVIIRKVDKGLIATEATGPVGQMQKVALQLASTSIYLSSNGPEDGTLDQQPIDGTVDDCFCWTIVGIAKFECTMDTTPASSPIPHHSPPPPQEIMPRLLQPSPPPSPPRILMPLPRVSSVTYDEKQHALQLMGQHFSHLMEFWLGRAHGPLRILQQGDGLKLALPPTHDFLVTHHDLLVKTAQGEHSVVLPLLMIRKDQVAYPTGQSIACLVKPNGDALWSAFT